MEALRYEGLAMPPKGKLPDAVIADFERWITLGAPDPRDGKAGPARPAVIDIEAGRRFWAYQPPRRHAVRRPCATSPGRRTDDRPLRPGRARSEGPAPGGATPTGPRWPGGLRST